MSAIQLTIANVRVMVRATHLGMHVIALLTALAAQSTLILCAENLAYVKVEDFNEPGWPPIQVKAEFTQAAVADVLAGTKDRPKRVRVRSLDGATDVDPVMAIDWPLWVGFAAETRAEGEAIAAEFMRSCEDSP